MFVNIHSGFIIIFQYLKKSEFTFSVNFMERICQESDLKQSEEKVEQEEKKVEQEDEFYP